MRTCTRARSWPGGPARGSRTGSRAAGRSNAAIDAADCARTRAPGARSGSPASLLLTEAFADATAAIAFLSCPVLVYAWSRSAPVRSSTCSGRSAPLLRPASAAALLSRTPGGASAAPSPCVASAALLLGRAAEPRSPSADSVLASDSAKRSSKAGSPRDARSLQHPQSTLKKELPYEDVRKPTEATSIQSACRNARGHP